MDGKGQVPLSLSVATPISSAEKDMNTRLSHSPVSPPISPTLHPANVNIKDSLFQGVAGAGEHQAIVAEGRAKRAEYRPVEIIGEGTQGTVKLAIHLPTGRQVALKGIRKPHASSPSISHDRPNTAADVRREVSVSIIPAVAGSKFYIVMELCSGGSLFDRIESSGQFDEGRAAVCIATVANAVMYLHDHGVCHRDLKPQNLLFKDRSPNSPLILVDFGVAGFSHPSQNNGMTTITGTPYYLAPELIISAHNRSYTNKIDVWSIGIITYQLLVGTTPFQDATTFTDLYKRIIHADFQIPFTARVSNLAREFIRTLLEPNAAKRPTAAQVLQHPWIRTNCPASYLMLLHEFNIEADPAMYRTKTWDGLPAVEPPKGTSEQEAFTKTFSLKNWESAGSPGPLNFWDASGAAMDVSGSGLTVPNPLHADTEMPDVPPRRTSLLGIEAVPLTGQQPMPTPTSVLDASPYANWLPSNQEVPATVSEQQPLVRAGSAFIYTTEMAELAAYNPPPVINNYGPPTSILQTESFSPPRQQSIWDAISTDNSGADPVDYSPSIVESMSTSPPQSSWLHGFGERRSSAEQMIAQDLSDSSTDMEQFTAGYSGNHNVNSSTSGFAPQQFHTIWDVLESRPIRPSPFPNNNSSTDSTPLRSQSLNYPEQQQSASMQSATPPMSVYLSPALQQQGHPESPALEQRSGASRSGPISESTKFASLPRRVRRASYPIPVGPPRSESVGPSVAAIRLRSVSIDYGLPSPVTTSGGFSMHGEGEGEGENGTGAAVLDARTRALMGLMASGAVPRLG